MTEKVTTANREERLRVLNPQSVIGDLIGFTDAVSSKGVAVDDD